MLPVKLDLYLRSQVPSGWTLVRVVFINIQMHLLDQGFLQVFYWTCVMKDQQSEDSVFSSPGLDDNLCFITVTFQTEQKLSSLTKFVLHLGNSSLTKNLKRVRNQIKNSAIVTRLNPNSSEGKCVCVQDTRQVVEVYKSGFDPPGDVEFEDYSATMRRSISESSYLDNRTEGRRHSRKLWPFIRKNKVHKQTPEQTQLRL